MSKTKTLHSSMHGTKLEEAIAVKVYRKLQKNSCGKSATNVLFLSLQKSYVIYMTCVNSCHKFPDIILSLGRKNWIIFLSGKNNIIFTFLAMAFYGYLSINISIMYTENDLNFRHDIF